MEKIPIIGFGTYKLKGSIAYTSTLDALYAGYTHIDTANLYDNEIEIGKAVKEYGISRNKIWITTKIQVRDIKKGKTAMYESILKSLRQLETDYLDLVLLHGPTENIIESWMILEEIIFGQIPALKDKVRHIGVSNYDIKDLEPLLKTCKIKPYANQFEISPFLNRSKLINYCSKNDIIPVAHTSLVKGQKFNDERLNKLSERTKISKSMLLLAWALNKRLVVLPRSSNSQHIRENIKCVNVGLDEEIVKELDSLDEGYCTLQHYKPMNN